MSIYIYIDTLIHTYTYIIYTREYMYLTGIDIPPQFGATDSKNTQSLKLDLYSACWWSSFFVWRWNAQTCQSCSTVQCSEQQLTVHWGMPYLLIQLRQCRKTIFAGSSPMTPWHSMTMYLLCNLKRVLQTPNHKFNQIQWVMTSSRIFFHQNHFKLSQRQSHPHDICGRS